MLKQTKLEKHTLTLPNLRLKGLQKSLTIRLFTTGRPDTIIFIGYGNEGNAAYRALKLLEAQEVTNTAVVSPLPYWAISSKDAQRLGIEGTIAAAEYIRDKFDLKTLNAIAESQAAAALIDAALRRPELFNGNISLLRPLGLVFMRKRDYVMRLARGAVQRDQLLDFRTVTAGSRVAWRSFQDLMQRSEQFDTALTWDIRDSLAKLALQKPGAVRVFAGTDDRLYPLEAMTQALEGFGLASLLETVPGGHTSPAIKQGSRQVMLVLDWVRSNNFA